MNRTSTCETCGETFAYEYRGGHARRWCQRHREAGHRAYDAAYSRQWRAANRDRSRAYAAAYSASHRDGRRSRNAKRRAVKRGAYVVAVDRAALYDRDGGVCYLCGGAVDADAWHLEHIVPLSGGGAHSWDNVAVACPRCNLSKGSRGPAAVGVGVLARPDLTTPPRVVRFKSPTAP